MICDDSGLDNVSAIRSISQIRRGSRRSAKSRHRQIGYTRIDCSETGWIYSEESDTAYYFPRTFWFGKTDTGARIHRTNLRQRSRENENARNDRQLFARKRNPVYSRGTQVFRQSKRSVEIVRRFQNYSVAKRASFDGGRAIRVASMHRTIQLQYAVFHCGGKQE